MAIDPPAGLASLRPVWGLKWGWGLDLKIGRSLSVKTSLISSFGGLEIMDKDISSTFSVSGEFDGRKG